MGLEAGRLGWGSPFKQETPTGELHVKARLDRDPGPSAGYAPAGSAGYAPAAKAPARAGAARWEFAAPRRSAGREIACGTH